MDKHCAWCGKIISQDNLGQHIPIQLISHGICKECAKDLFEDLSESLSEFLERFDLPILVVNPCEEIIAANKKAIRNGNISPEKLKGMKCGDVLECVHAEEAGGCGKTVHCHSCVIRNTVLHTYKTGKPFYNVPAVPDLRQYDDSPQRQLLISTEKIGETVVLRIEETGLPSQED